MLLDQIGGVAPSWVDRLTLETLAAADAPAISRHLGRLEGFDRYSRFFSGMSDENIDRYVERLDWGRMIAVGLYQDDDLIGIAELGWEDDGCSDTAEMAVTVDSAYRHRGIGDEKQVSAGWKHAGSAATTRSTNSCAASVHRCG